MRRISLISAAASACLSAVDAGWQPARVVAAPIGGQRLQDGAAKVAIGISGGHLSSISPASAAANRAGIVRRTPATPFAAGLEAVI